MFGLSPTFSAQAERTTQDEMFQEKTIGAGTVYVLVTATILNV